MQADTLAEVRTGLSGERIVTLGIGQEMYGIAIENVESVVRWEPLTRLPRMPRFLAGIYSLRSQVIPIMDMRLRLDLPAAACTPNHRIVIIRVGDLTVGLIVDSVREVVWIEAAQIETRVPLVSDREDAAAAYIRGIANLPQGFVILLDVACLLSTGERTQLTRLKTN
jgi:purine-binding chemotaxis protein CheW